MSNTKRALEMLRELHIRGEHEWLDQEDIGTVIAALEADASPSASEPLPDGWTQHGHVIYGPYDSHAELFGTDVCVSDLDGEATIPASVLRALLGRSEPTRAEVERDESEPPPGWTWLDRPRGKLIRESGCADLATAWAIYDEEHPT